MPLKYPLHRYDEAGRMKPPIFIYGLLLFVCRGLLVLIVSLSFREDSERLLRIFYPEPYHFYLSLIPILPALFCLVIVSRRNLFWEAHKFKRFKAIPILVFIAIVSDMLVQFYMLHQTQFAFSITRGLSILVACGGLLYFFRSRYIKHLLSDWSKP